MAAVLPTPTFTPITNSRSALASVLERFSRLRMSNPAAASVRWPWPEGFVPAHPVPDSTPACVVRLTDGQILHGHLTRFVPGAHVLRVRLAFSDADVPVPVSRVKSLRLAEPVALIESERAASALTTGAACEYRLEFTDREVMAAETKGWVRGSTGVFLYTTTGAHSRFVGGPRQQVCCQFVPAGAIRDLRLGAQTSDPVAAPGAARTPAEPEAPPRVYGVYLLTDPAALECIPACADPVLPQVRLGDLLTELGLIDPGQLAGALARQQREPQRKLGELLCEMTDLDETAMQQALARRLGVPVVDLQHVRPRAGTLERVERSFAMARAVAPLHENADTVYVAMADPADEETVRELRFRLARRVIVVHASRASIAALLQRCPPEREAPLGLTRDAFFA